MPLLVSDEFANDYENLKREVDRLRRKVDGFNGPGINNSHGGMSFNPPTTRADGEPDEPDRVIFLKITATAAGSGEYDARTVTGECTITPSGGVVLPGDFTVAAADDLLAINPAENNLTGHAIAPDANGPFMVGLLVDGYTSDSPPRRKVLLCGGGDETITGLKHQVKSIIDDVGTKAYDWVRAH